MIQNQTLTFILVGGEGSRLYPLTARRSKPSVPFGGKCRIIDFTLTNCLHSGLRRVLVLTQYKSHSLNKHLRDGWSVFNPELGEYITPVPAQMNRGEHWYEGTADAIFQNLNLIERSNSKYTMILTIDAYYKANIDLLAPVPPLDLYQKNWPVRTYQPQTPTPEPFPERREPRVFSSTPFYPAAW